jgi:hypothetical protein
MMTMPKQPTAAAVQKAQAVLAWFSVTHDMAGRSDEAVFYASAIVKLDADMLRAAQNAAKEIA